MGNIGSLEKAELRKRSVEASRSCNSPRCKVEKMFEHLPHKEMDKQQAKKERLSLDLPSPVFEFESKGTDTMGYESDMVEVEDDEKGGSEKESPPEKAGFITSLFRILGKPFTEPDPSLVVVKGRIRQPSSSAQPKDSVCEGTSHCDVHQLQACQGFTLLAMRNISALEAKELKARSIVYPASLVGYQICIFQEDEISDDGDYLDENLEDVQNRIRVICAYSKEATDSLFRRSRYRIMAPNGELEWVELRRGPSKRGINFTPLRRVC